MKYTEFDTQARLYEEAFIEFNNAFQLPPEFFAVPDHIAIKCANGNDYLETLEEVKSKFNITGVWEVRLNGRRLASAQLAGKITIANSDFEWLEIMEPRRGKETTRGFVEHTEFVFADAFEAQRILNQRGVEGIELQENPGHGWVNVIIDDSGREIKLNNKPLAKVVEQELSEGKIKTLITPKTPEIAEVIEFKKPKG